MSMQINKDWLFEGRGVTESEPSEYFIKYVEKSLVYRSLDVWDLKTIPLGRITRAEALEKFNAWKEVNSRAEIRDLQLVEVRLVAF